MKESKELFCDDPCEDKLDATLPFAFDSTDTDEEFTDRDEEFTDTDEEVSFWPVMLFEYLRNGQSPNPRYGLPLFGVTSGLIDFRLLEQFDP